MVKRITITIALLILLLVLVDKYIVSKPMTAKTDAKILKVNNDFDWDYLESLTEVTEFKNGSIYYPPGTIPNADSAKKNNICATKGMVNTTSKSSFLIGSVSGSSGAVSCGASANSKARIEININPEQRQELVPIKEQVER